ncbi:MAG: ATP-binding cassette domain-containing protein [Fluviicola sp.]|nr:ATP-binding cassette domain-containing protein [Fluviicola sp.]
MEQNQSIMTVDSLTKEFQKDAEAFYALNNISFELYKGEVLGVIGRNGSGKSTLLKVLSQITGPSSGEISYEGQLTSIIDIGTGFHADLSGKENIYLSALLLGYSKKEIKDLYDDIVDFSGLHDFMQMPVKHYSSGMYLRLAFSIAFHSKISILLLDEVIAVGDTDFKRKCYSKIQELKARGTAIILVSHHLELIVEQCDRCIMLDDGKILYKGNPLDVVNKYYELIENHKDAKVRSAFNETTEEKEYFTVLAEFPIQIDDFKINEIEFLTSIEAEGLTTEAELVFRFHCTKMIAENSFEIGILLTNMNGVRVMLDSYGLRNDYEVKAVNKGDYQVDVSIPPNLLSAGVYRIGVFMGVNRELVKEVDSLAKFKLLPNDDYVKVRGMGSVIRPKLNWKINHVNN